jgi:hypothetical protein
MTGRRNALRASSDGARAAHPTMWSLTMPSDCIAA